MKSPFVWGPGGARNLQGGPYFDLPAARGNAGQVLQTNGDGTTEWADAGGSSGPTLPGSSTDNALVRWVGAGGDEIADSKVILDNIPRMFFPDATSAGTGGAQGPGVYWADINFGIYSISSGDQMGFRTGNNERMRITSAVSCSSPLQPDESTQSTTVPGLRRGTDQQTGFSWTGSGVINAISVATRTMSWHTTKIEAYLPIKLPSYTDTTRGALSPEAGWMIWNTDSDKPEWYDGTQWIEADGTPA